MKASILIQKLQSLKDEVGDVDVLITDGFQAQCWNGEYDICVFKDFNGNECIDIGIGGCLE